MLNEEQAFDYCNNLWGRLPLYWLFKSSETENISRCENNCRADWHVRKVDVRVLPDHPEWTAVVAWVGAE